MKHLNPIAFLAAVLAAVAALALLSCQDPEKSYNSWTFSGYVLDGHSGRPLEGVAVHYQNGDGKETSVTTGTGGNFFISEIPYGEKTFRFIHDTASESGMRYTSKSIIASSWRDENAATDGEPGDVSRIIRLFPMSGSLSGKVIVKLQGSELTVPAARRSVRITYKDTAMADASPSSFAATTDSEGAFTLEDLPLASGITMDIPSFQIDMVSYTLVPPSPPLLFPGTQVSLGTVFMKASDTTNWALNQVVSNVLSGDGFGRTGVPVDIVPFYVLSTPPDSQAMEAVIEGGGAPEAVVTVRGDTVFVRPVRNLEYNSLVTVTVTGKDRKGNRIHLAFSGSRQFRTERGVFPIASNTWDASGQPAGNFVMYDTMWVRWSEPIHADLGRIQWQDSEADHDIFGAGVSTNAAVWIRGDTLFVKPDPRLAVDFGKTMGFKVAVTSREGKPSAAVDFRVRLQESQYFVKWTNAKDQLGNVRADFGVMDSVVVVSNVPIEEVTGISEIEGSTPPPDMTLDNIRLRGDTLVYKPSLRLKPNTTYGMDFHVTFRNGVKRDNVLGVSWKTVTGIRILAVNNREAGNFRELAVFGDSLTVNFSKTVDTSLRAPIRFKVNIKDVKGVPIRTAVAWDGARRQATLRFLDTLPAADYDASPAYTSDARNTRAVDSISFDLAAADGEQVFRLGPGGETIELHSAKGLCPLASNVLPLHDPLSEIDANESPVDTFPVDGAVTVAFNHALDTATMQAHGGSNFAGLEEKDNGLKVPCTVRFSTDAKTLSIVPAAPLGIGKQYFVWLSGVRGRGISGAKAINKHGGSFTGKSSGNRLLLKAFKTRSPDIRALEAAVLPDSNTLAGVEGNRLGISAGYNYSAVAGISNIVTDASLKFRIAESAWNARHADSVNGYQVQVQKVDRGGAVTAWYDLGQTIAATTWRPSGAQVRKAEVNLATASFYGAFTTPDGDGVGGYYLNNTGLFNDSAQVRLRIRPYVGSGDPLRGEVGVWSSPIVFTDNVAPCDSDFVTAANCNNLAMGGVQVTEHVSFNNAGPATVDTGYVEVTFPEDMDPTGPVPTLAFFYGPFGGTNPPAALTQVPPSSDRSRWISARKYRIHVSVPVFDYTNAASPQGAYYNVSVAGVRTAGGLAIQTYGSDGELASGSIDAAGRNARAAAAGSQVQGSASVVAGFVRCD